jgi:hypothetical protein
MPSHRIVAAAAIVLTCVPQVPAPAQPCAPATITVSSATPEESAQLSGLIADVRKQADAFVFLSGGASRMQEDQQRQLLAMFDALSLLAKAGRRIAVGDGGTKAGIMEAAGSRVARAAAHSR